MQNKQTNKDDANYFKILIGINKRLSILFKQNQLDGLDDLLKEREDLIKHIANSSLSPSNIDLEKIEKTFKELINNLESDLIKTQKELVKTKKAKALIRKYKSGNNTNEHTHHI